MSAKGLVWQSFLVDRRGRRRGAPELGELEWGTVKCQAGVIGPEAPGQVGGGRGTSLPPGARVMVMTEAKCSRGAGCGPHPGFHCRCGFLSFIFC